MIDILDSLADQPRTLSQLCAIDRDDVDDVLFCLRGLAHLGAIEPIKTQDRLFWRIPGQSVPAPPRATASRAFRQPTADRRARHAGREERPTSMEILTRMVVRSSFRTPKRSSSVQITPIDIAHAVGAVAIDPRQKLGAAMAMAMACQRAQEWTTVLQLGRVPLLQHLRNQRARPGVVDAPYTYRARVALHDAFYDLVHPGQRRNLTDAAATVRMRRDLYVWLIRESCAFLEEKANSAAADATQFLFATHRDVDLDLKPGQLIEARFDEAGDVVVEAVEFKPDIDIDDLCRDVLARPPCNGLLHLRHP